MDSQGEKAETVQAEMRREAWLRGLWMLFLTLLFELARIVLYVLALVQFLWLLFGGEKNRPIGEFGAELARWQAQVASYLSGASEARPFPFAKWGEVEEG